MYRRTLDRRWTTQKVFHLLNFVCAGVRAGVFPVRRSLDRIHPEVGFRCKLEIYRLNPWL